MNKYLLICLLLILSLRGFAQEASLSVTVLDEDDKSPLAFAVVMLFEGDLVKYGFMVNEEGSYHLTGIQPGIYTMQARYLGNATEIQAVQLIGNRKTHITIEMPPTKMPICDFPVPEPMEQFTRDWSGTTFSAEEIRRSPYR